MSGAAAVRHRRRRWPRGSCRPACKLVPGSFAYDYLTHACKPLAPAVEVAASLAARAGAHAPPPSWRRPRRRVFSCWPRGAGRNTPIARHSRRACPAPRAQGFRQSEPHRPPSPGASPGRLIGPSTVPPVCCRRPRRCGSQWAPSCRARNCAAAARWPGAATAWAPRAMPRSAAGSPTARRRLSAARPPAARPPACLPAAAAPLQAPAAAQARHGARQPAPPPGARPADAHGLPGGGRQGGGGAAALARVCDAAGGSGRACRQQATACS